MQSNRNVYSIAAYFGETQNLEESESLAMKEVI